MNRTTNFPILLVEDDENDVFFFKRAVEKSGITNPLLVVRDGQDAIHYLGGTGDYSDRNIYPAPRLVVLDLNLPVKHGLQVLEWIRSHPATNNVIVLVLTSSIDVLDMHEAYSLGANAYLVKPADPNELSGLVDSIKQFWLGLNVPPPLPADDARLRGRMRQPSA